MHIRPAVLSDLPSITTVLTRANQTDALSHYICTNRDLNTASNRIRSLQYMRWMLTSPFMIGFVAIADSNDDISYADSRIDEVIGFAFFHRMGKSDVARRWQVANPEANSLERVACWVSSKYTKVVPWADPATDRAHMSAVQSILDDPWEKSPFKETWIVEGLYVDPAWQGKGFARKLLGWVKLKAKEEQVPVVVRGSAIGGPVYRKCGFVSIGFDRFGEFIDELEFGGEVHQAWVFEPEGVAGWVEKGKTWWKEHVGEEIVEQGVQFKGSTV